MTLKELIEYAKEYAEEINERVQGKFENAKENYRSAKLATRRFISRHQLSLSILFAALVTGAVVGLAVLYVPAVAAFLSGLVVLGAAPFVGLTLLATALIAGGLAAAAVALTLAGLAKVIHSYRRRRIREKYSLNESDDEVDEYKNNSVVDYIKIFLVKHKFSLSILSAALAIGAVVGLTVFYVPAIAAFLTSIVVFGVAPFVGLTLLATALVAGGLAAAAIALTVSLLTGLAKVFNNYQRRRLLYRDPLNGIDKNTHRLPNPFERIQQLEQENFQLRQQLKHLKQTSTLGVLFGFGGR